MKIRILSFILLIMSFNLVAQNVPEVNWTNLMDITFKDIYLEKDDIYVYYPLFGEKQKKHDGQTIQITGYIIPIDVEQNQYVLSAFPFSACFFCGNAGPESVMAVYFQGNTRVFNTDERLKLEGTLELNDTNVDELVYVLRNARVKP
ncbi:DUF3299 domain-containing protein [Cryomorpha ignava]|uniref:DUF3299 domain-containing protein n=1 Tax=Cryomorpha ignava TaxID=101383 RepID=A0A7K3WSC3_9FLAO|nr:DUF3299 domain-containing protein [Cryomorpha ignava]NEN23772.1 DUF3299 domain-containing protein [Cryomorpha ignava]